MSDDVPEDFKPQKVYSDEEIKEIKEKQKDDDNRMWTDEEIKELKEKADKENALDIMTQMAIQDTATIFQLSEEAAFWKRLFLIGLTVFLIIESLWIFLYLSVNTDIINVIWNFLYDISSMFNINGTYFIIAWSGSLLLILILLGLRFIRSR